MRNEISTEQRGDSPADDAIRAAQALQGGILDLLPGAVMASVDGAIVFANPAALALFGVADLATLRDREAAQEHLDKRDVARLRQCEDSIARGENVAATAEYCILRPDCSTRVVEWTTLATVFADRPAWLYSIDDVTAFSQGRVALAASEAHFLDILAALAEGVIVVDRLGVCTEANPSSAELLRLPSAELLLDAPAEAMPLFAQDGTPLERSQHPLWRALDTGEHVRSEIFGLYLGRRLRKLRISVMPIEVYGEGAPVGAVVTFDDVTGELDKNERIARSEARFKNLAAISPVGILETDPDGMCTYVNDKWCELTGLSPDEAMGDGWTTALHPDDKSLFADAWLAAMTTGEQLRLEFRYRRPDGSSVPVHAERAPIIDTTGRITGWIGASIDLSAELELRQELRDKEARFRLLAEHSPDVVMRINRDPFRLDYISPAIAHLTGSSPEDHYADPGLMVRHVHPDDVAQLQALLLDDDQTTHAEFRLVHLDGTIRTVDVRSHLVTDHGRAVAVEATMRDVTSKVAERDLLDQLAHHDALTGLLNRRALFAALDLRLASGQCTAVLFFDLDGFKAVNDTHGHDAGDRVLLVVAQRLSAVVREQDIVARIGGDEFVIVGPPQHAEAIARRVLSGLAAPIMLDTGEQTTIGVSIGISHLDPTIGDDCAETMIQRADQAMYEAKRRGKGQIVSLIETPCE